MAESHHSAVLLTVDNLLIYVIYTAQSTNFPLVPQLIFFWTLLLEFSCLDWIVWVNHIHMVFLSQVSNISQSYKKTSFLSKVKV